MVSSANLLLMTGVDHAVGAIGGVEALPSHGNETGPCRDQGASEACVQSSLEILSEEREENWRYLIRGLIREVAYAALSPVCACIRWAQVCQPLMRARL